MELSRLQRYASSHKNMSDDQNQIAQLWAAIEGIKNNPPLLDHRHNGFDASPVRYSDLTEPPAAAAAVPARTAPETVQQRISGPRHRKAVATGEPARQPQEQMAVRVILLRAAAAAAPEMPAEQQPIYAAEGLVQTVRLF